MKPAGPDPAAFRRTVIVTVTVPLVLATGLAALLFWNVAHPGNQAGLRALGTLGLICLLLPVALAFNGRRRLDLIAGSYARALEAAEEQARAARESEARFAAFMDHTPALAVIRDEEGRLVYGNAVYQRFLGGRQGEAWGQDVFGYLPAETAAPLHEADMAVLATGEPLQIRSPLPGPDGKPRNWLLFKFPLPIYEGRPFVGTIAVDVTDQELLEEQLLQAQKLEAIGQLAGGVAHDFNNLLVVINGYSELLLDSRSLDPSARLPLEEIRKAGDRAAGLTRQLLTFSRRQVVAPQLIDLNDVVSGTEKMLRRLIGEDIEIHTSLDPGLWQTMADPGQIEQVIMNLAVNARDAMAGGGRLTLETANAELDETYTRNHAGVAPGSYVLLAVSDTGCGMGEGLLSHVFEPFFTTKEAGRGTGLGLATVHGIVKQSGGHVWVYSEPGVGTTFKIYLPPAAGAGSREESALPPEIPGGSETVLLVEDDEPVRAMVTEMLARKGYRVLTASGAEEGFELARGHAGPLPLLITDLVMPGGSGRQLAERIAALRPGIRTLYMSGYTNDVAVRHGVLKGEVAFIQKPFTPDRLALRVREVLDAADPHVEPEPSEQAPAPAGRA